MMLSVLPRRHCILEPPLSLSPYLDVLELTQGVGVVLFIFTGRRNIGRVALLVLCDGYGNRAHGRLLARACPELVVHMHIH